jgi:hypothetical protein
MTLLARLDKRHVQADFQFLGNHVISFLASLRGLTVIRIQYQFRPDAKSTGNRACPLGVTSVSAADS